MGRNPREQGPLAHSLKRVFRQAAGGAKPVQSESSHRQRMSRKSERGHHVVPDQIPVLDKRPEEAFPFLACMPQQNRRSIIQRMRERYVRLNPFQPMFGEPELLKAW